MAQPSLFDHLDDEPAIPPDQAARDFAVDPGNDVVLEASAGTGKTRVLVDRYVRLLTLGVDPRHILAMTFTRKAAAEMRERVLQTLRREAESGRLAADVWATVRSRLHDVQITTIDGFCFGLLREFPLEAGVDPAFDVADETEMARFTSEALDVALERARGLIDTDERVRLLFVRVRPNVLRAALHGLIDRRQVALPAVLAFVGRHSVPESAAEASSRLFDRLRAALADDILSALVDDGPVRAAEFQWLADDLRRLAGVPGGPSSARLPQLRRRLESHFLTRDGKPRLRIDQRYKVEAYPSKAARERHQQAVRAVAPAVAAALEALDRDLDRVLARGLLRVLVLAVEAYERLLAEHALLDFAGMLDRAVTLLGRQEEFARSRLKLQARYHHLLLDEFQDTSRQQWRLVELLIDTWVEGEGVADVPTSIFVVGDRKQSIYRFRHAEVTLLDAAARRIGLLRPDRPVRQAISTSFRSVPELLAFVNALAAGMVGDETMDDRWSYRDSDRFPTPAVADGAVREGEPVLGLVAQSSIEASAAAVADEVVRLLQSASVRDREHGARPARPDDIAILFRARAGHQYFEDALERRGVRTYVYKGLGFFDAPEVQDLQALLRFLARPESDLRAAEFLRSRFVRLSDAALQALAPQLSRALLDEGPASDVLAPVDAALLALARAAVQRWLALARDVPPGEVLDVVLRESAYAFELRGRRLDQARENLKKVRALVRRVENRGYVTLERMASYFETLRAGDESNATVQAVEAVNLMTIHAAKGLEFPIVFVVNLHAPGRGRPAGVSVVEQGPGDQPDVTFATSPATELEDRREAEELRRLLYVAVTRARDRLYLTADLDRQGRIKTRPRSLAALLPGSLTACFAAAHDTSDAVVTWQSPAGRFTFRVCRPSPDAPRMAPADQGDRASETPAIAGPLMWTGPVARAASTAWATARASTTEPPTADLKREKEGEGADDRLVGVLVHRMLQREFDPDLDDATLIQRALGLLLASERLDVGTAGPTVASAIRLFRAVRRDPTLTDLLKGAERHYEVPFSVALPEQLHVWLRGSVDCLVRRADGTLHVVEFKTGRPRPEHQAQLELYVRAIRAVFPGSEVAGRICYPDESLSLSAATKPLRSPAGLG